MKRRIALALIAALGFSVVASAKSVKKNYPKKSVAVEMIKQGGEEHYPKNLKFGGKFVTLKFEEGDQTTYWHFYTGSYTKEVEGTKTTVYRLYVFNNDPKYMGYYEFLYEPKDYEERAILIDASDSNSGGEDDDYFRVPVSFRGPEKRVNIDGEGIDFVKFDPTKELPTVKTESGDTLKPEYREWTVNAGATINGRKLKKALTFKAIYVKKKLGGLVVLKGTNGKTVEIRVRDLSEEDKEYLKPFLALTTKLEIGA